MDLLDTLTARGFVKDVTDPDGLRARLSEGSITLYAGFDPTATSLHVGNLLGIMLLSWFQRAGHRVLVVMGGGTALVGDPAGKDQARDLNPEDAIERNLAGQKPLYSRYLRFGEGDADARLLNNADWLINRGYIEFLRDIGRHFSVNEMVAAETYSRRLRDNKHLPFIEFNYRLIQAYDFLHLHREFDCVLQTGGSDQWGNCVAGTELIRKATGGKAWVLTTPLLQTSSGAKMGKTEKGSVWLTEELTSAWDYFQFWMNCEDPDTERFLKLYTYVPLDQIEALTSVGGVALRPAKARLAWEATAMAHGEAAADAELAGAIHRFGLPKDIVPSRAAKLKVGRAAADATPTIEITRTELEAGIPLYRLFGPDHAGLCKSGGEARRLSKQGGAYVGEEKVLDGEALIGLDHCGEDGSILLRAGKKRYVRVVPV